MTLFIRYNWDQKASLKLSITIDYGTILVTIHPLGSLTKLGCRIWKRITNNRAVLNPAQHRERNGNQSVVRRNPVSQRQNSGRVNVIGTPLNDMDTIYEPSRTYGSQRGTV